MSVAIPPSGFARLASPPAATNSHISKSAVATHSINAPNAVGSTWKCRAGLNAQEHRKEPQHGDGERIIHPEETKARAVTHRNK